MYTLIMCITNYMYHLYPYYVYYTLSTAHAQCTRSVQITATYFNEIKNFCLQTSVDLIKEKKVMYVDTYVNIIKVRSLHIPSCK